MSAVAVVGRAAAVGDTVAQRLADGGASAAESVGRPGAVGGVRARRLARVA